MRPFAVYPASFDGNTLGLWRFGERGGLLTDVVAGKVLTNFGAEPLDDGYRFVTADNDYMEVVYAGEPARNIATLEAWVRDAHLTNGTRGEIARFLGPASGGGGNDFSIRIFQNADPTLTFIAAYARVDGVNRIATWRGLEVDDLLASSVPFHIAAVRNSTTLKLFVNGVLRHGIATVAVTDWPAGDWTLYVGTLNAGTYFLQGVLDEVRLSESVRYAANFPITRFQDGRRLGLRGPEVMATAGGIP